LSFKISDHEDIKGTIAELKEFGAALHSDPESGGELRLAGGFLGILAAFNEGVEWSYWAVLVVIFSTVFNLCMFIYRVERRGFYLLRIMPQREIGGAGGGNPQAGLLPGEAS